MKQVRTAKEGSVIILSAAAGVGHVRAAEALMSALVASHIRTERIEVLKYTTPIFRKVYSDLYIDPALK